MHPTLEKGINQFLLPQVLVKYYVTLGLLVFGNQPKAGEPTEFPNTGRWNFSIIQQVVVQSKDIPDKDQIFLKEQILGVDQSSNLVEQFNIPG